MEGRREGEREGGRAYVMITAYASNVHMCVGGCLCC